MQYTTPQATNAFAMAFIFSIQKERKQKERNRKKRLIAEPLLLPIENGLDLSMQENLIMTSLYDRPTAHSYGLAGRDQVDSARHAVRGGGGGYSWEFLLPPKIST